MKMVSSMWLTFSLAHRISRLPPKVWSWVLTGKSPKSKMSLRSGWSAEWNAFVVQWILVLPSRHVTRGNDWSCSDIELFPSFNYGRDEHETTLFQEQHFTTDNKSKVASFHSKDIQLQLDVAIEKGENETSCPLITFRKEKRPGVNGEGLVACIRIEEGQTISFVLRNDIEHHVTENITIDVLDAQQHSTQSFWYNFIAQSKYKGRWREVVSRSLMILKMMTYGEVLPQIQPVRNRLTFHRAYWCYHSCPNLFYSRSHRWRKKLGLSLLLDSWFELYYLHPATSWFQGRSRCLYGVHHGKIRSLAWPRWRLAYYVHHSRWDWHPGTDIGSSWRLSRQ